MSGAILSDLCGICNNDVPKYQCPRCTCRTCSLPCYKRHQKWSQCSGKRDPAAYVKRSRLATASGIDRDYNFLSGLERVVVDAERISDDRGIELTPTVTFPAKSGPSSVQQAIENRTVKVHRAPKGMSREKVNHTRLSMRKNLIWTVEWIRQDGTKILGECLEETTLEAAYLEAVQPTAKRRKRKHLHGRPDPSLPGSEQVPVIDESTTARKTHSPLQTTNQDTTGAVRHSTTDQSSAAYVCSTKPSIDAEMAEHEQRPADGIPVLDESCQVDLKDLKCDPQISSADPCDASEGPQPAEEPPMNEHNDGYFYLQKPFVQGGDRVLIPRVPNTSMAECLRGQEVFEFPSIYILTQPSTALPKGFILEAKRANKLIQELDT